MTRPGVARGPKFVSGRAATGLVTLTRDDGTTHASPFWVFDGVSIADNGNGSCDLTVEEG